MLKSLPSVVVARASVLFVLVARPNVGTRQHTRVPILQVFVQYDQETGKDQETD